MQRLLTRCESLVVVMQKPGIRKVQPRNAVQEFLHQQTPF